MPKPCSAMSDGGPTRPAGAGFLDQGVKDGSGNGTAAAPQNPHPKRPRRAQAAGR